MDIKTIYVHQERGRFYLDRNEPVLDPTDPAARIKWQLDQIREQPFVPYLRMLRYDLPQQAPYKDLDSILHSVDSTYDVTTWEAQYCLEKGIPLLSEQSSWIGLIDREDFPQRQHVFFMLRGAASRGTTGYMALELPEGVLLFSNSAKGKENFRILRQYMADHYFNPGFKYFALTTYGMVELPEQKLEKVVDKFGEFYVHRNPEGYRRMPSIPQEILCDRSVIDGMPISSHSESNGRPSVEEFDALTKNTIVSPANADIAYWLFIEKYGYPPVEYTHAARSGAKLNHAGRLLDELSECAYREQADRLRKKYRQEARAMLKKRYPDIRGVKAVRKLPCTPKLVR